jgi:hypothetical protein
VSTYTTEAYYGRVSVACFDRDLTVQVGEIIAKALQDAGIRGMKPRVSWVLNDNGQETIDAAWDGKRWQPR